MAAYYGWFPVFLIVLVIDQSDSQETAPTPLIQPRETAPTPIIQNRELEDIYNSEWRNVDGQDLFEGDIALSEEQKQMLFERKAVSYLGFRWTLGSDGFPHVPYLINDSAVDSTAALAGISHWMDHTCIIFEEVSDFSSQYINFIYGSGCWSYVGMMTWPGQDLSLGNGCNGLGTVVHEIGHAMGFYHEQSRSDRDAYVAIFTENVKTGFASNFEAHTDNNYSIIYDLSSDMHYGSRYFTKDGKVNIVTTIDPLAQELIGSRSGLSHYDKLLANTMYPCIEKWQEACGIVSNPCQNNGYVGENCDCVCPSGTSGDNCQTVVGDYYASLLSGCSERITSEGEVKSPNYPNNYDQDVKCVKLITAPDCHLVQITFNAFEIYEMTEHCEIKPCCYFEILEIRLDGVGQPGEVYCGTDIDSGQNFTSTGNQLLLYFETRVSFLPGWSANVTFVPDPTCSSTTTTTTPTTTTATPTTTTATSTTTTSTTTTTTPTTTTTATPTTTIATPTTTTATPTTTTATPTTTTATPTTTTATPTTTTATPTTTTATPTTTTATPTTTSATPTTTTATPTTTTATPTTTIATPTTTTATPTTTTATPTTTSATPTTTTATPTTTTATPTTTTATPTTTSTTPGTTSTTTTTTTPTTTSTTTTSTSTTPTTTSTTTPTTTSSSTTPTTTSTTTPTTTSTTTPTTTSTTTPTTTSTTTPTTTSTTTPTTTSTTTSSTTTTPDMSCDFEILSATTSRWTSPNFGHGNYPQFANCTQTWFSNAPRWAVVKLTAFNLATRDYVTMTRPYFSDIWLRGTRSGKINLPSYNFEAQFVNEPSFVSSGFKIAVIAKKSKCHKLIRTGGIGSTGIIKTPKRNKTWTKKSCEWWIKSPSNTRIKLAFVEMGLNRNRYKNSIIINGEGNTNYPRSSSRRYWGRIRPPVQIADANEMNILFYSTFTRSKKYNFKARWTVISP